MSSRGTLTRERIIAAASCVADERGLSAVSMRSVARQLGVEAMSLYHHVANKDALLAGLADWAFDQIGLPAPGTPWLVAMRSRAVSMRKVLSAHPWALVLLDAQASPGPSLMGHHDAVLGLLHGDGLDYRFASHAYSVLDSYVYGFVLTEQSLPFDADEAASDFVAGLDLSAYPHLAAMAAEMIAGGVFVYADEFEDGLDLILDGLTRRWNTGSSGRQSSRDNLLAT